MTLNGWIQILIFCGIVVLLVQPLGGYMTRVYNGERTFLSVLLTPFERLLYGLAGTDEREEQHWTTYVAAMLAFNLLGFLVLYLLQRFQAGLPFNPAGMAAVPQELSFNTAVSFVTNTNWQNYGGESTMSYLVQMAGLTVQNFVSAATGMALAVALIRGFARASAKIDRQFLGRSHPFHALRAFAALHRADACLSCSSAYRRRSAPMSTRRRWKAASRRSPLARWPRSSP